MAKSSKKHTKKKESLDKEFPIENLEENSAIASLQNVNSLHIQKTNANEVEEKVEDNTEASTKSKKKKKKKKKTPSESETTCTENENNTHQRTDSNVSTDVPSPDMLDLSRFPEITVIKLPQAVPDNIQNIENKESETSTSTTSKKKKKKKKSVDNTEEREKSKPPENIQTKTKQNNSSMNFPATESTNDVPVTTNPSYFKMEQSKSTVFLVSNPPDNTTKNSSTDIKPDKIPATVTMGPGSQCLLKNPDHINMQNQLLQKMGKGMFPQYSVAQPSNFVSLTSVGDGINSTCEVSPSVPNLGTNISYNDETGEASLKTKAQLKAERRAIQEAQRAAKEANRRASNIIENHQILSKPVILSKQAPPSKTVSSIKLQKESHKALFSHLPQFKSLASLEKHLQSDDFIHPAIISVGSQYAKNTVVDPNVYCIEVLSALKNVIKDYKTPPNKELRRDLGEKLEKCIAFLTKCKPFTVGTTNAMKFLKLQIGNVPEGQVDDKAKEAICEQIDKFTQDSICLAVEAISNFVSSEINDGDAILVYGYSLVVKNALCKAKQQNKYFKVIIIDSRPTLEGRHTLSSFLKEGIPCSYALMSALTYAMKEVTKVIIGAHAVRASGYVMSRTGTSQIALLASSRNVPFLVCCESYKFCDRALIDSFFDNELGDPESFTKPSLIHSNVLENWKDISNLDLINLLYDVTPPHLISKIITEKCHSA